LKVTPSKKPALRNTAVLLDIEINLSELTEQEKTPRPKFYN
jgi:hypothetical protein